MPESTPEWEPGQGVSLNMRFLGDLAKLFGADDSARETLKSVPWQMFTQTMESGRPGPVYVTRKQGGTASVDYLLQPNLIVKR